MLWSPESLHGDGEDGGPEREEEVGGDGELLEEPGWRHSQPSGHQQLVAQSTHSVQQRLRE